MSWYNILVGMGVVIMIVAIGTVVIIGEKERIYINCEIPFNGSYCWTDCEEQPKTVFGTPALGYCQQCHAINDKRCNEQGGIMQ